MSPLIPAFSAIRRQKIPDARAAITNGVQQDLLHRVIEPPDCLGLQPAGHSIGMKSGAIQDFIRIDVADPGNDLLMHEQGFEAAAAPHHQLSKLFPRDGQRVTSEALVAKPLQPGEVE